MISPQPESLMPALDALLLARSALTNAGRRVALAQRHIAENVPRERIGRDLAMVPESLDVVANAINQLAERAGAHDPIEISAEDGLRD